MLVQGQTTNVFWNSANKDWYVSKGYQFTKMKDYFIVKVEDLTKSAQNIVKFICDYCSENYDRAWNVSLRSMKVTQKHSCQKCSGKKKIESKVTLGTVYTDKSKKAHDAAKLSLDDLIKIFRDKNYSLLSSNYTNNKGKLIYICNFHPEIGEQKTTVTSLKSNKHNCISCQKIERMDNIKKKIEGINTLDCYKKVLSGEIEMFPNGFFKFASYEDISLILNHFIEISLKGKEPNKNNIISVLNSEVFDKYKLTSLIQMYGINGIVNNFFSDIKLWEIGGGTPNFWKDDKNVRLAVNWFYEKLIQDEIIYCDDDIINIRNWKKYFKKYKLEGLLNTIFNSTIFKFWDYLFPNRWFEWEYIVTSKSYWDDKNNVIKSLKQLIEETLKLSKEDIPRIINYPFLVNNYYKFSYYCDKYYHSNIFKWINDCYPNEFDKDLFKYIIANDGTEVDSRDEKVIHDLLLKNNIKPKYFENKIANLNLFVNEDKNESYVPDWIINDYLIIEYFGWYNKSNYNYPLIKKYIDKADRKIEYFNNLEGYAFLGLFPNDLKDNLKGLLDKFHNLNIDLVI